MYSIFTPKTLVASSSVLVLMWLLQLGISMCGGSSEEEERQVSSHRGNEGERKARKEEEESI